VYFYVVLFACNRARAPPIGPGDPPPADRLCSKHYWHGERKPHRPSPSTDWRAPKQMPRFGVAVARLVEWQTENAGPIGIVLTTRATARTHAAAQALMETPELAADVYRSEIGATEAMWDSEIRKRNGESPVRARLAPGAICGACLHGIRILVAYPAA
jgi:hypothetical protein